MRAKPGYICNASQLPGKPVRNASDIKPENWRFFSTVDPQVSVFLSRDLDSRISAREVAAVTEWLQSGEEIRYVQALS